LDRHGAALLDRHSQHTPRPSSGCTSGCTTEGETTNAGTVEALAAALLGLSPEDRARLTALLLGTQSGNTPLV
jgi:hypothetical protein